MLKMGQLAGFWAGGASGFDATYLGGATNTSAISGTQSFGSFSVPEDGLLVVIHTMWSSLASRVVSSLSIGGVSSPLLANTGGGFSVKGVLSYREVSAGSVGISAAITGGSAATRGRVSVFLVRNYSSPIPLDSGSSGVVTSDPTSLTLEVASGGAAFYGYAFADSNSAAFTGAEEVFNANIDGERHVHAVAAPTPTNPSYPASVSVIGATSDRRLVVGASWR